MEVKIRPVKKRGVYVPAKEVFELVDTDKKMFSWLSGKETFVDEVDGTLYVAIKDVIDEINDEDVQSFLNGYV